MYHWTEHPLCVSQSTQSIPSLCIIGLQVHFGTAHYVRMSHTADLNLSNPNVPLRLAFSWEHRVDCYTKADHIIICSKLAFNTPDTR